jgi:hypothetical protein
MISKWMVAFLLAWTLMLPNAGVCATNCPEGTSVVQYAIWDAGDTIEVNVCGKRNSRNPSQALIFYLNKDGQQEEIASYEDMHYIQYIRSLDNDNILTVWETGSSLSVRIYHYENGSVSCVFYVGAKLHPELVDINNDLITEILITRDLYFNSSGVKVPGDTSIYQWDGNAYSLVGQEPYMQRLKPLHR